MDTITYLGVRFDRLSQDVLVKRILSEVGFCSTIIVTPNVDHVVRINKSPKMASIYKSADVSVNDSRVLKKIARIFNKVDLGPVVTGSDLTEELVNTFSKNNESFAVIGCNADVIKEVSAKYTIPPSNIEHYNPPMGFIEDDVEVQKCIDFMLSVKSKYFFMSVGSPRQEVLALKAKEQGVKGVMLCVGASLNFLGGEEKRAPKVFQALALEWLYRFLVSPRRMFKRYFVDCVSIFSLALNYKK